MAGVIKLGQLDTAVSTLGMGLLEVPRSRPKAPAPRTALENFCHTGLFGLVFDGNYTHHFIFV